MARRARPSHRHSGGASAPQMVAIIDEALEMINDEIAKRDQFTGDARDVVAPPHGNV